jgi:hypothetical protein
MANYKAVANGNWSNLAIWQDNSSGSFIASTVLPGASDDVYGNNFSVTINQDITVASLRTTSATGIVQQGSTNIAFTILTSRNITCTGQGIVTPLAQTRTMLINALNSTVNIVADVTTGNNGGGGDDYAIQCVASATLTVNHTGNVYYLFTGSSYGRSIQVSNGNIYNLTGNVYGQGVSRRNTPIYLLTGIGSFNLTGNLYGGACIGANGASNINIVGDISVTTNTNAIDIWDFSYVAISLTFSGNITTTTANTIAFNTLRVHPTGNISWQFLTTNAGQFRTLYTPGVATGHPATNNVRTGIVYGPTNNLTGTCAVPPAAAVSLGVPVDNTVGTASLDANALAAALNTSLSANLSASLPTPISASLQASLPTPISASLQASLPTPIATALNTSLSASLPAAIAPLLWDESVTNITTPNSIGERLKNCSTVATTGAQIASFNP